MVSPGGFNITCHYFYCCQMPVSMSDTITRHIVTDESLFVNDFCAKTGRGKLHPYFVRPV